MLKYIILLLIVVVFILFVYSKSINVSEGFNQTEIDMGREYFKSKKVAFCGLIRDGEKRIPHLISKIENMGKYFKEWEVLIVENDSKDDTRKMLLDWASINKSVFILGCDGVNLPECKLNMKETVDHDFTDYRIVKMAKLRNIYLEELKKREDIDLVIVLDLDLISEIDEKGFLKTGYELSVNNDIKAVCSNGLGGDNRFLSFMDYKLKKKLGTPYHYYDTYAYRDLDDKITPRRHKLFYDFLYRRDPDTWENNKDVKLKKVRSCFGGLTIYRKDALINSSYGTYKDMNGGIICEHEFLNEQIDGVYHSNELLHFIYEN